jgi:hypothetical protein
VLGNQEWLSADLARQEERLYLLWYVHEHIGVRSMSTPVQSIEASATGAAGFSITPNLTRSFSAKIGQSLPRKPIARRAFHLCASSPGITGKSLEPVSRSQSIKEELHHGAHIAGVYLRAIWKGIWS